MILFAWRRLTPPAFIGGAELTEAALARRLVSGGHQVAMIGSYQNPRNPAQSSREWLIELLRSAEIVHEEASESVVYDWEGVACYCVSQREVLNLFRTLSVGADVVVSSQEGSAEILGEVRGAITSTYIHSVSRIGLESLSGSPDRVYAPSRYVAEFLSMQGRSEVVLVRPPLNVSRTPRRPRPENSRVLFVNPVREKGESVAVELASRLPDVTFDFVEGWRSPHPRGANWPDNIRLLPRRSDLTQFYDSASLLIVPSVVEDASPRVISEAGLRGRPVLGSNRGAIPELIASPSNVIDPTDIGLWRDRVRALLDHKFEWALAARQQRQHAEGLLGDASLFLADIGASSSR